MLGVEFGELAVVEPALVVGLLLAKSVQGEAFDDKPIHVGDMVYFDSWLASKYPTGEGDKTFWLVNYEDIRAVQKADTKE